ncbi:MAG: hypothetical protein KDI66_15465 [Xanthomonadales bacterium]|nr:hypothetical protein [Xanthomonadales bacterium]
MSPLKRRLGALARWPLLLLLMLAVAYAWAALSVRAAVQPRAPAGFHAALDWLSVSNGETDANVGLRFFSMAQVQSLESAFPKFAFIAASPPADETVLLGGREAQASLQFVKPDAFAVAGVHLSAAAPGAREQRICVASRAWLERQGLESGAQSLRVSDIDFELRGAADQRLRMLGGPVAVDLWCSWDATGELLLGGSSGGQDQIPVYWLFVGLANAQQRAEWLARTREIQLPRAFGFGEGPHRLLSLDGWVPHPALQETALLRLSLFQGMAATYLGLGLVLVCFAARQHVRRRAGEIAMRYVLGARPSDLLRASAWAHLRSLLLALPPGGLIAQALFALLWRDPDLAQARFSGVAVGTEGLGAALLLALVLCALAFATEAVLTLRLARAPRFDVSAKSALVGLRQGRGATALLTAFACLAAWVSITQAQRTQAPIPESFGLARSITLLEPQFDPHTSINLQMLPRSRLAELELDLASIAPYAFIESYPARNGVILPGQLLLEDGRECGISPEVLRGTSQLSTVLGLRFELGQPPVEASEIALSVSRARRCFGSTQAAIGATLDVDGALLRVAGVYADIDWNLGRGSRSDFVAGWSEQAFTWYAVAPDAATAARLQPALQTAVQAWLPALKDLHLAGLDDLLLASRRDELALARLLTILALALTLGAGLSAAGLYSTIAASQRGALALHLALGAAPVSLTRRAILPLILAMIPTGIAVVLLALAGSRVSPALSALIGSDLRNALAAVVLTACGLLAIALRQVATALRAPDVVRELSGA